jgi:hypothetical protein
LPHHGHARRKKYLEQNTHFLLLISLSLSHLRAAAAAASAATWVLSCHAAYGVQSSLLLLPPHQRSPSRHILRANCSIFSAKAPSDQPTTYIRGYKLFPFRSPSPQTTKNSSFSNMIYGYIVLFHRRKEEEEPFPSPPLFPALFRVAAASSLSQTRMINCLGLLLLFHLASPSYSLMLPSLPLRLSAARKLLQFSHTWTVCKNFQCLTLVVTISDIPRQHLHQRCQEQCLAAKLIRYSRRRCMHFASRRRRRRRSLFCIQFRGLKNVRDRRSCLHGASASRFNPLILHHAAAADSLDSGGIGKKEPSRCTNAV